MNIVKSIVQLTIGAAFGVGMVLSCGDSSLHHSDATTCDCPASEAPIAGRLVVIESPPQSIAPGEVLPVGTGCTPGMQFLSGTCTAADPTRPQDVTVVQFGFDKTSFGWDCVFKNNGLISVMVKTTLLCLRPTA
jgi:hypothetical protein